MNIKNTLLVLVTSVSLSGCALWCGPHCGAETRESSSLVEFLYPNQQMLPADNSIPQLTLPVRVGLAFLPSRNGNDAPGLEAPRRAQLLERVRQRFADRKFVREIVVIPDYYLKGRIGFEGLAGVQRLYGVDVMALVSYDQVTYRDDNSWSLGYITIVGQYLLKGTKHDVITLMDLAVVDPASRSILLRAGGTDERHGTTTLISQSTQSRQSQTDGFSTATDELIGHFDAALTQFEADVRNGKANVRVVNRNASSSPNGGAGAFDLGWIILLAMVLSARLASCHEARCD